MGRAYDAAVTASAHDGFRHEAIFYTGGLDGFVGEVAPLVAATIAAGGSAVVATPTDRVQRLAAHFADEPALQLLDMTEIGVNPARIIPAWRDLADQALTTGRPFLGVGEPIWAGRSAAEIDECHRHEALINVAFATDPAWRLVCPYDVDGLPADVVADARATHPLVHHHEEGPCSGPVDGLAAFDALERPLPAVPAHATTVSFGPQDVAGLRAVAASHAAAAELGEGRAADLALVISELATNAVCHGGGSGALSVWNDGGAVVCEARNRGRVGDAMVGRRRPTPNDLSGRGVWIMHQLCDLVQIRHADGMAIVRVTVS